MNNYKNVIKLTQQEEMAISGGGISTLGVGLISSLISEVINSVISIGGLIKTLFSDKGEIKVNSNNFKWDNISSISSDNYF